TEQDEIGPNTFCKKLRVDRQGIDPTGDAEGGLAPDIGELNISATKVLASGDHLVTFVVDLANRTELGRGDTVTVWVDADRQAADALLDEAGPLGMALGALVEAVDLELEPVEAELEDQVPLEELRRPVGQPPAAKVGMHRERAQVGYPAAPVCDLEAHQARGL